MRPRQPATLAQERASSPIKNRRQSPGVKPPDHDRKKLLISSIRGRRPPTECSAPPRPAGSKRRLRSA